MPWSQESANRDELISEDSMVYKADFRTFLITQRNSEPLSGKQNKQRASKKNSLWLRQHPQELYKLNSDQTLSWKKKAYIKHHPYPRTYRDLFYAERGEYSFLTLILGVPCYSGRKHIHGYMDSTSWVWMKNIHIG